MDILLSPLEFAASYNSTSNLRMRIHQIPSDRPPLNLLRQEIEGTTIYLDILHKTTSTHVANSDENMNANGPAETISSVDATDEETACSDEKLKTLAEEKFVSFCGQILKEASDLQPITGEAASADIHRVIDLRAPIVVKVLKGMCRMESRIFRRHLRDFYPLVTKLVCCDQMDVRGAHGDLFSTQLTSLLPKCHHCAIRVSLPCSFRDSKVNRNGGQHVYFEEELRKLKSLLSFQHAGMKQIHPAAP